MYLMCRTCLDMDSKYFQISDYVDDSHSIIEMLDGIVPQINIIEEENIGGSLAPLICENCLETLITSYKFQQLCIEADVQIRHLIATQSEKHEGIECIPPEEKDNDNMLEHQVVEEFENEKVETKIEIEYDFDRKEADETGRDYTVNPKEDEVEAAFDIVKHIPKLEEMEQEVEATVQLEATNKAQNNYLNSRTRFNCPDCGKRFDRVSRLKTHRCFYATRRHLFACDLCNRKFVNEQIYISHRQRHEDNVIYFPKSESNVNIAAENGKESKENDFENEKELEKNITELVMDDEQTKAEEEFNIDDDVYMENFKDDDSDDYEDTMWDGLIDDDFKIEPAEDMKTELDNSNTFSGEIEKPNIKNRRSNRFPCDVCGKIYDRISRLQRHSRVHSLHKPFACDICKVRFSTSNYLKTHMLLHTKKEQADASQMPPEGYQCPDCPRRFEKLTALSGHRRKHKKKSFTEKQRCLVCHGEFLSVKTLVEHIRNKHPDHPKHPCDQCDKEFVIHEQLVQHKSRHTEKDLICNVCHKEFPFASLLKEHLRTHTGETPFLCPECGKLFKCSGNLRQHMERHSSVRKYACPKCPMRFKCKIDVKKHAETHLGLKPYECEICGSRFTRSYALEQHKLLHFATHACEMCEMSFSSAIHLRRHLRTHADENMY